MICIWLNMYVRNEVTYDCKELIETEIMFGDINKSMLGNEQRSIDL